MHVVQIVTATVAVALVCALGRAGRVRVWNTMSSEARVFMFSCGRAFNDATHNFDAILIGPFCIVYAQCIAVLWLDF